MKFANIARRYLIRLGKLLPFAVCFIVLFSYTECMYAVLTNSYGISNSFVYPYKPISQLIGCYFEYDWMSVLVLTIISFAVETCRWNKLAVLYLALHLLFKQWVTHYEFLPAHIIGLCLINITICTILCYKGLTRL